MSSSPSAEITAGGEGIAMSDESAQQLRRQKYIPEFPPRRGERFPLMWGFIPHVRGRFRSNAHRDGISMEIDSSGHLLFHSSARKISTNIYFYFSISIICSNFAAAFCRIGQKAMPRTKRYASEMSLAEKKDNNKKVLYNKVEERK